MRNYRSQWNGCGAFLTLVWSVQRSSLHRDVRADRATCSSLSDACFSLRSKRVLLGESDITGPRQPILERTVNKHESFRTRCSNRISVNIHTDNHEILSCIWRVGSGEFITYAEGCLCIKWKKNILYILSFLWLFYLRNRDSAAVSTKKYEWK